MTSYKLIKFFEPQTKATSVLRDDGWAIPFDPANRNYQQFVEQINADEATLEGVDGNVMTPEEAKAYVATLPKEEAPVDAPA